MIYLYFEIGILSHQRLLRKDFQNNFVANFADVARNNVSRKERKVLIISRKGRKVSQRLFYCLFLAKFAMLRKVLQYFLLIIIIIISWRTWRTWRETFFFFIEEYYAPPQLLRRLMIHCLKNGSSIPYPLSV